MGVDMWAAELLLRMKEQQAYQDVELCLALPFERVTMQTGMTGTERGWILFADMLKRS